MNSEAVMQDLMAELHELGIEEISWGEDPSCFKAELNLTVRWPRGRAKTKQPLFVDRGSGAFRRETLRRFWLLARIVPVTSAMAQGRRVGI